MLRTIDISTRTYSDRELRRIVPRGHQSVDAMLDTVRPIVDKLKTEGAAAALEYSEKFDRIRPPHLRVLSALCQEAADALDPDLKKALTTAISRVRAVHEAQKPADVEVNLAPGATVTQKFIPISRVGLYVPGGNAVYPSSVIMNVVPAQAAGVDTLVVASPPQKDNGGYPHPTVLAVCALLREAFDDCALTTDVMTGFPGETPEEFAQTQETCRRAGFSRMHVFPYSEREGTKAAQMPGSVPRHLREERARELIALGRELERSALAARVGRAEDVLIEELDEQGDGAGYTGGYMRVHVPGAKEGTIVRVRVTGVRGDELLGELIDDKE